MLGIKFRSFCFLLFTIILSNQIFSQSKKTYSNNSESYQRININNISTGFFNDGFSDTQIDGNSGFIFPKNSGKSAIYSSGLNWGAKINGELHIGGSIYQTTLQPGNIVNGEASNPTDLKYRIYRVRPDIFDENVDLSNEINDEKKSYEIILSNYKKDWNEWPSDLGAPFTDIDNNGKYDPNIDIPGIEGADQTLWYVANDLNYNPVHGVIWTNPLGIELQVTIWAYNNQLNLKNTIFRKYKLFNKSNTKFDSMYVGMWADPDLGFASDDYVGCDSTLSMMFTYNGISQDQVYGYLPPAVGFTLLKSSATNDKLTSVTQLYKNFYGFMPDPDVPIMMYYYLQGLDNRGQQFINPVTGLVSKFVNSGDPINKKGWIEEKYPPGDRRQLMNCGPFELKPGENAEFIYAQQAAFGDDYLSSIGELKKLSYNIQSLFKQTNGFKINFMQNPVINSVEVDGNNYIINWERNPEIENYSNLNFAFEGYNLYQLHEGFDGLTAYKKITSIDKANSIGNITQLGYDPSSNSIKNILVNSSNNQGLEYQKIISKDVETNSKFLNGKEYRFGISAYSYNESSNSDIKYLESDIAEISTIYNESMPGLKYHDNLVINHSSGIGEANINIQIVDNTKLTGHEYELSFKEQHYYLEDGEWKKTDYPDSISKLMNKDISSAYFTVINYVLSSNERELYFVLNLPQQSSFTSYPSFVKILFPSQIKINDADRYYQILSEINEEENSVSWGSKDSIGVRFWGNINFTIRTSAISLPSEINYILWNGEEEVSKKIIIDKETHHFRTERQWDILDKTTNKTVLKGQRYFDDIDPYADFWNSSPFLSTDFPSIDGFHPIISANFEYPYRFTYSMNRNLDSPSESIFMYGSSEKDAFAINDFGNGVSDEKILLQDYIIKYNGTFKLNNNGIYEVVSGGSYATIINAENYELKDHPLNPNPGSNKPFLIKIPFEIWNKDLNKQVNLLFIDKYQYLGMDKFYAYPVAGRALNYINNTDYNSQTANSGSPTNNDTEKLTRVFILFNLLVNDPIQITLNYPNPIEFGLDKFTFTTPNYKTNWTYNLPDDYKLYQNFPNPFNPSTTIPFYLKNDGFTKISIYNILGQRVKVLSNKNYKAGNHKITFNASNLSSGVYFYKIESAGFVDIKKMLLIK